MVLHVHVRIPASVAASAVAQLDVSDALFHQPPRHEQLPPEIVRLFFADTVQIQDVLGFVGEVHYLGRGNLHPRRQFVRLHAAGDVRVDRIGLAEFLIEPRQRLHLQFALGGGAAFRRIQIRNRCVARAKRSGGRSGAEIPARQLHGRRWTPHVDERRQVLVRASQRIRDPASQAGMIERAAAMPGGRFNHGRKMIALVIPHGTHHGNLVDHAADVRQDVGHRNSRLSARFKRADTRNDGPLDLGDVVSECGAVHHFPGMLVVLRVERIQLADAAAHEEIDDGFGLGFEMRADPAILQLAVFRQESAERGTEESAGSTRHKSAPRDSTAGIGVEEVHRIHLANTNSSRLNSSQAKPLRRAGSFARYVRA